MPQAAMRLTVAALFILSSCSPKNGGQTNTAAANATSPPGQAAPQQAAAEKYTNEQLEALLAPIALYPDELLTQVLMASTFPSDITAAQHWLNEGANKSLKGAALEQALTSQPWDPSVKSVVPFPQVLGPMSQHIDWTQQIGYAMQVERRVQHRPAPQGAVAAGRTAEVQSAHDRQERAIAARARRLDSAARRYARRVHRHRAGEFPGSVCANL
jgi:hypothetical protein